MKHTKEPWNNNLHDGQVLDSGNMLVSDCHSAFRMPAQIKANAKRIVDCVNALEGIDDPKRFVGMGKNYIQQDTEIRQLINADDNESTYDEVERLKTQRDRLLEALENLANAANIFLAVNGEEVYNRQFKHIEKAMAAIAKAKGGKP